ncbi:MAG TPA: zf-HC2 domain-containing protein [Candidatus Koribacter sp.]|jgi:hypothetical protein
MSSEFQNRLRKSLEHEVPVEHPSADALNAYAEHALTTAEEREVAGHLSVCAECRETVFLASSAREDEEVPAAPAPVKAARVRWWAWAIPATAVIAVSAVIFVPSHKSTPMAHVATTTQPEIAESKPQGIAANEEPKTSATAPSKQLSAEVRAKNKVETAAASEEPRREASVAQPESSFEQSRKDKAPTGAMNAPSVVGLVGGSVAAMTAKNENLQAARVASAPAPAPPPPAASAKAASSALQVTNEAALLDQNSPQELPNDSTSRDEARAYKAAPAMRLKKAMPPPTAWMVNTSGQLAHLVNARWQVVNPAPGTESALLSVATQGDQVWAAGRNLTLYYSPNNGLTWQTQTIPAFRQDADVVHIEFSSEVDGLLKLSDGEAFTTHDRGRNWVGVPEKR